MGGDEVVIALFRSSSLVLVWLLEDMEPNIGDASCAFEVLLVVGPEMLT